MKTPSNLIDPKTGLLVKPKISFKTRYGIVNDPFSWLDNAILAEFRKTQKPVNVSHITYDAIHPTVPKKSKTKVNQKPNKKRKNNG